MIIIKVCLLFMLCIATAIFLVSFVSSLMIYKAKGEKNLYELLLTGVIAIITSFLDCLGIGSFALATSFLRGFKLIDDRNIPGTLNVGFTLPTIAEAFLFISVVNVHWITLFSMIGSSVLGAIIGAEFICIIKEKTLKLIMSISLLIVAVFMILSAINLMPGGGEAIGFTGYKLVIATIGNFILGALMMSGIGLYAPCMALVYTLGLNPTIAFPIMMGSCAFLMPVSSLKFIKHNNYDKSISVVLSILGIIGVFIAYKFIIRLPLNILKWMIIIIVIYNSIDLFRSVLNNR